MRNVTVFNIKLDAPDKIPNCSRNLSDILAIIFTGRAHADNHLHTFADVLFPLFLTSHQFDGNVIFLVTYQFPPWISGYELILKKTIQIRRRKHRRRARGPVLYTNDCRPQVPIKSVHSSERIHQHFDGKLLEVCATSILVAVRLRAQSRNESSSDAHNIEEPQSKIGKRARDLLRGAEITPYGVDVEAQICFEWAGELMNLRYLEYKATLNESSLLGKYPVDSVFYRDPEAIKNRSYGEFQAVYLGSQDLRLDLDRFKKTLFKVSEILDS
ncbi:hypothetical protein ACS0TY_035106 [Phlomoides rotata]